MICSVLCCAVVLRKVDEVQWTPQSTGLATQFCSSKLVPNPVFTTMPTPTPMPMTSSHCRRQRRASRRASRTVISAAMTCVTLAQLASLMVQVSGQQPRCRPWPAGCVPYTWSHTQTVQGWAYKGVPRVYHTLHPERTEVSCAFVRCTRAAN